MTDATSTDVAGPPSGFTLPDMEARRAWLEQRVAALEQRVAADLAEIAQLSNAIAGMRAVMGLGGRAMGTVVAIRQYVAGHLPAGEPARIDVDDLTAWANANGWVTRTYDRRTAMLIRLSKLARNGDGIRREGAAEYWTVPEDGRIGH